MRRESYVTSTTIAELERTLSPRDRALVTTLDDLRVATTEQLRRLHFANLSETAAARQAAKVLQRLHAAGVLSTLPRDVGGAGGGSATAVWALDRAGQRLASEAGPAGGRRIRRPWMPGLAFLAHRLTISELYVEVVEASRAGACELLSFEAEPLSWRRFAAPYGGHDFVKPDASVRLGLGDFERGAFVEVDRATQGRQAIVRKCRVYRQYWESGREQDRRGYFPQVLFGVPDERRRAWMNEVLMAQPEEARELFRCVLQGDLLAALTKRPR